MRWRPSSPWSHDGLLVTDAQPMHRGKRCVTKEGRKETVMSERKRQQRNSTHKQSALSPKEIVTGLVVAIFLAGLAGCLAGPAQGVSVFLAVLALFTGVRQSLIRWSCRRRFGSERPSRRRTSRRPQHGVRERQFWKKPRLILQRHFVI